MSDNTYEGDPIDISWQDFKNRPYGGSGETVDVVNNISKSGRSEFAVPDGYTIGEKTARVLKHLEEMDGKMTVKQIAEQIEMTKHGVRDSLQKLSKIGVVYCDPAAGKWGADLWTPVVDVNDLYTFPDGLNSDLLPSNTHPIRLTQTQRKIIGYAVRNPTRTQAHIARQIDVSQPTVHRTLKKYHDPRKEINELEVGHANAKIEIINNRIEHFQDRISELRTERSELKQTVVNGGKDV